MNSLMTLINTNPKSVNLSKDGKVVDDKTDSKINAKDFISILFSQIKNHANISAKEDIKIPIVPINAAPSAKTSIKSEKSKSSNELLLGEILNIITMLKGDGNQISFPKFSGKLDKILNEKSVLNEFKNIKSLDDIFKISKKYNLGLKEVKLTKEDIKTLKKDFPKLNSQKFFEVKTPDANYASAKQNKLTTKSKKHVIIEKLIQNLPGKQNNEQPKNILQSLLSDVDKNTQKVIIKNIEEDKKIKVEQYIQKDKTNVNKTINRQAKESPHTIQKESKQSKTPTYVSKETVNAEINKKEKISKKTSKNDEIRPNKTIIGEVKQEKIQTGKNLQDRILHKIKTQKNANVNSMQTLVADDKSDTESTKDIKSEQISHKQEFKSTIKVDTFKPDKNVETKSSINHFSNDLKEKIEQYKPPIMKVKMALNPKNLGEVEVTLIHRGSNLHVNIVSNTNTMSLFTQNQAEFKNSLVNMGFTNLEMNFSDQGKNSGGNQQNRKNSDNSFEEFNNQENHESAVELIVPRYI